MPKKNCPELNRLKELMSGYTQEAFAEKVKMSQSAISKISSGHNSLSADSIIAISKACNVSADWLLGLSDDKQSNVSYGDILRVLATLIKDCSLSPASNPIIHADGTKTYLDKIDYLLPNNLIIEYLLEDCAQQRSQPNDIYNYWLKTRLEGYSKIPYQQASEEMDRVLKWYLGYEKDLNPDTLAEFFEQYNVLKQKYYDEVEEE